MVELNAKQLTAIARFNREFSVLTVSIENVKTEMERQKILVKATLNTKSQKKKAFYLDDDGQLAGVVKDSNEDSPSST